MQRNPATSIPRLSPSCTRMLNQTWKGLHASADSRSRADRNDLSAWISDMRGLTVGKVALHESSLQLGSLIYVSVDERCAARRRRCRSRTGRANRVWEGSRDKGVPRHVAAGLTGYGSA